MNALTPWRTRISPWAEFDTLQERLDRMMGRTVPRFATEEPMEWMPAVDLKEEEGEFVLRGEFPGMSEEDIEVAIEQNVLTLRGEKRSEREEKEEKNGRWHLVERSWGAFQRSFSLPQTVDVDGIQAEFKDGLLTVHLPKKAETQGRRIAIGKK